MQERLPARPAFMPRAQVLYLDGIDESLSMAEIAYERLRANLLTYDSATQRPSAILLDAWSIVDVLNRLRALVPCPGMQNTPAVKALLMALGPIEEPRNAVQHLHNREIRKIADTGRPVWGTLSWVVPPSEEGGKGVIGGLYPGTLAPVKGMPLVNPAGRECERPVGLVTLTAADQTICLSELVAAARRFGERLARAMDDAFAAPAPAAGANIPLNVDLN